MWFYVPLALTLVEGGTESTQCRHSGSSCSCSCLCFVYGCSQNSMSMCRLFLIQSQNYSWNTGSALSTDTFLFVPVGLYPDGCFRQHHHGFIHQRCMWHLFLLALLCSLVWQIMYLHWSHCWYDTFQANSMNLSLGICALWIPSLGVLCAVLYYLDLDRTKDYCGNCSSFFPGGYL